MNKPKTNRRRPLHRTPPLRSHPSLDAVLSSTTHQTLRSARRLAQLANGRRSPTFLAGMPCPPPVTQRYQLVSDVNGMRIGHQYHDCCHPRRKYLHRVLDPPSARLGSATTRLFNGSSNSNSNNPSAPHLVSVSRLQPPEMPRPRKGAPRLPLKIIHSPPNDRWFTDTLAPPL